MAALRKIVDVVNGRRFGRGSRGLAKFKPGDNVYIAMAISRFRSRGAVA